MVPSKFLSRSLVYLQEEHIQLFVICIQNRPQQQLAGIHCIYSSHDLLNALNGAGIHCIYSSYDLQKHLMVL